MRSTLDSLTFAGVHDRARVQQLIASGDVREALAVANAIEHPWYRCQSVAEVAEVLPEDEARPVIAKALRAAHEEAEPNRIVTVAAWPIGVMARRGLEAGGEVEKLLAIIDTEPHSLRRAHALFMLFASVFPDATLRERVLAALVASLRVSHGWRAERVWAALVTRLRDENADEAARILQLMPEGREKRRLTRAATPPPASPPSPA